MVNRTPPTQAELDMREQARTAGRRIALETPPAPSALAQQAEAVVNASAITTAVDADTGGMVANMGELLVAEDSDDDAAERTVIVDTPATAHSLSLAEAHALLDGDTADIPAGAAASEITPAEATRAADAQAWREGRAAEAKVAADNMAARNTQRAAAMASATGREGGRTDEEASPLTDTAKLAKACGAASYGQVWYSEAMQPGQTRCTWAETSADRTVSSTPRRVQMQATFTDTRAARRFKDVLRGYEGVKVQGTEICMRGGLEVNGAVLPTTLAFGADGPKDGGTFSVESRRGHEAMTRLGKLVDELHQLEKDRHTVMVERVAVTSLLALLVAGWFIPSADVWTTGGLAIGSVAMVWVNARLRRPLSACLWALVILTATAWAGLS